MTPLLLNVLFIVVAYLLGSLSFAVIVSRRMDLADPRGYGSGNPGATNMLRSGRKSAAALTLIGDGLKGWLAVWLAKNFGPQLAYPYAHRRGDALAAFEAKKYREHVSEEGCQATPRCDALV